MAKILIKHYLWLIDKLSKRPMTLAELCDSYERSTLFEPNHPLQPRTLYNWREKIDELFGLQIAYTGDTYKLRNLESLNDDSPERWLLQSLSVNDVVKRSSQLKQRILLENIPSGDVFLTDIIEAMEDGKTIRMVYRKFSDTEEQEPIEVEPYCVKVNNRRWYVLCHFPDNHATVGAGFIRPQKSVDTGSVRSHTGLAIYALDRIQCMEITDHSFVFPKGFSPEAFFADHFGVCIGYDVPVQRVEVRFYGEARKYLRTLPLHPSQREVHTFDDYSVFEFRLHPTVDFVNALLSYGDSVEVLEPLSLRCKVAEEVRLTNNIYTGQQKNS